MNILFVLVPVSLVLGGVGLVAFVWSLRAGQYEDLEGDAMRILLAEDDTAPRSSQPIIDGTQPR